MLLQMIVHILFLVDIVYFSSFLIVFIYLIMDYSCIQSDLDRDINFFFTLVIFIGWVVCKITRLSWFWIRWIIVYIFIKFFYEFCLVLMSLSVGNVSMLANVGIMCDKYRTILFLANCLQIPRILSIFAKELIHNE